jgi:hypothetical protein
MANLPPSSSSGTRPGRHARRGALRRQAYVAVLSSSMVKADDPLSLISRTSSTPSPTATPDQRTATRRSLPAGL